jgi:hypothetical protein
MDVPADAGSDARRISCGSGTSCWALGAFPVTHNGTDALAQRWNGTSWSAQAVPTGLVAPELSDISCASTSDCQAVGSYLASGQQRPLIVRLVGTTWSVVSNTGPPPYLSDISCSAVDACIAVGPFTTKRWDGFAWSTAATNGNYPSYGFSCRSATSCEGVAGATIFHWNGTKWLVAPISSTGSSQYYGVSCSLVTNCIAVGFYTPPSANARQTLATQYS